MTAIRAVDSSLFFFIANRLLVRAVEWGRERRFVRRVLAECLGGHRCTKEMGVAWAEQRPECGETLSRVWNCRHLCAESGG